ncbi:hypothetical protein SLE2022_250950 [Rubroshorea leprosula]
MNLLILTSHDKNGLTWSRVLAKLELLDIILVQLSLPHSQNFPLIRKNKWLIQGCCNFIAIYLGVVSHICVC